MSITCKSCGTFIMSVFTDTCDACVVAQSEQNRKNREREARNERARLDAIQVNSLHDSRQQSDDISLHAATIALWPDAPLSSSSARYESNVDTKSQAWTPPASTYAPAESCGSSYDNSSSCSDSSSSSSSGGGD